MTAHRQRVIRADGRTLNVVQHRGHLSYCFTGCCCGRTERGYAEVPVDVYKEEWTRRKMRNDVHLTKGGCLGPCSLANVASLVFDGHSVWFHSVNSAWQVRQIFDYIESMLNADRFLKPPAELSEFVFNYYDWDVRTPAALPDAARAQQPTGGIMLLSHADTDLLTLARAKELLPPDLEAHSYSLNALHSEDQMDVLLAGELGGARIIILRSHSPLQAIPGFARLRATCVERGQSLLLISGTGELSPEFSQTVNVPSDVIDTAASYLALGGVNNLVELCHFLSDRLLLTGHGYAPPLSMPEHGVYLPEMDAATIEEW